ncbi:DUF6663 family protein [Halosegnis sp.]|uniref:DUF6663 family protein n=1 Tax=Halosegnis sp. TaxID=2864959 RepID=UPI0035D5010B
MEQTTAGEYRVLPGREDGELLLLDVESGDPTYVPADDEADLPAVGNRITAELAWVDGDPQLAGFEVVADTSFHFVRTDEPIFEAATRCWEEAKESNAGMSSRVTHGTDGEPNGIVYTFARQPGQRDLFAEFRDGVKPLEPLLVRAAGGREAYPNGDAGPDPPFEVFVIAAEEPFVAVYIVLDPVGFLAETVRDTYVSAGGLTDRL